MSKPRDAIGNKLYVDDLVRVQLDQAAALGKIVKIDDPSAITVPSGTPLPPRPGVVTVQIEVKVPFVDAQARLGCFLKLIQPPKDDNA